MSRTYAGPSESQSNAEALARRSSPYTAAHETSLRVRWDCHRREPSDLREAVRMVRRAYSDEVPDKLHDGPDAIGEDGTPRMTARAVGYIFNDPEGDDAGRDPETGVRDLAGWHFSPFRACLARCEQGNEADRFVGAVVRHVTIGGQGPRQALMAEGVPQKAVGLLAFPLLVSFLRNMTDLKLHPRQGVPETETAA